MNWNVDQWSLDGYGAPPHTGVHFTHYLRGEVVTSAVSAKRVALTGKANCTSEDLSVVGALVCKVNVIDNK